MLFAVSWETEDRGGDMVVEANTMQECWPAIEQFVYMGGEYGIELKIRPLKVLKNGVVFLKDGPIGS